MNTKSSTTSVDISMYKILIAGFTVILKKINGKNRQTIYNYPA